MSTMFQIKEHLLKAFSKNRDMERFIQSRSDHKNAAAYSQFIQSHFATHPASETQLERVLLNQLARMLLIF